MKKLYSDVAPSIDLRVIAMNEFSHILRDVTKNAYIFASKRARELSEPSKLQLMLEQTLKLKLFNFSKDSPQLHCVKHSRC